MRNLIDSININKSYEKKVIIKSTYRKIILAYFILYLVMNLSSLFYTEGGAFIRNLLLSVLSLSVIILSFIKNKTTDIILLLFLIIFALILFLA